MKLITLALMVSLLSGCHRSHDKVAEAASGNPSVQPPTGPVCSQQHVNFTGEFHPPVNARLETVSVFINQFDLSKDTLLLQAKCFVCTTWNTVRGPGGAGSNGLAYSVSGSTVTITYTTVTDVQWSMDSLVLTCR